MSLRRLLPILLLILALALPSATLAADGAVGSRAADWGGLMRWLLPWLLPLGIAMVALGAREPERAHDLATALPLALVLAVGGYLLCGYGLQFGGIGLLLRAEGTAHLTAEWSPLDLRNGPGWGLVGLKQIPFDPSQATGTELALFLSQLPLVTAATLIPLTSLHGRAPRLAVWLTCLLADCLCAPLAGNWLRGGGWLTPGVGVYGLIDAAPGYPFLVGGGLALAGLVAFRRRLRPVLDLPPSLPRARLPLYAMAGALLTAMGWAATIMMQPLTPASSPMRLWLGALGALVGSSAASLFYGWLARGKADAGLCARGIVAGIVAISSGIAGVSFWSALLIGAAAGLALAPTLYLVERVARLDDAGRAVSVYFMPALWGLLAVGLLEHEAPLLSWNDLLIERAPSNALTVGAQEAGPFLVQLLGAGALLVLALGIPWLLLGILAQAYALSAEAKRRFVERSLALGYAHETERVAALGRLAQLRDGTMRLATNALQRRPRFQGRRLRHRQRLAANEPLPETMADPPDQDQPAPGAPSS